MPLHFLLALLLVTPAMAHAEGGTIFTLADPRGDDHGDGSLVYPLRDDLAAGDLDLLELSAREEKEGTLFEATFARPIASPKGRIVDPGGSPMESLARLGFYTFNIDIYIDTDRIIGSGDRATVPGRRASVDSTCAWERVVLLAPRPAEARKEIASRLLASATADLETKLPHLEESDLDSLRDAVDTRIEERYFFPSRVRVNGRKIQFFVPSAFLAAPREAAYVVLVTASDPFTRHDLGAMLGLGKRPDPGLMMMPLAPSPSRESVGGGRRSDDLQPPVFDMIAPPGRSQEEILKDYDLRSGRPVALPGVLP